MTRSELRPLIIAIIGPDGSGKTTQSNLLVRYLKDKKARVHYTWISSHHCGIAFLRTLAVKVFNEKYFFSPYTGRIMYLPVLPLTPLGRIIWKWLELFSVLIVLVIKVILPFRLSYFVIVERYLPSTIADFVYAFGKKSRGSLPLRILLRLCSNLHSMRFIFLDANYSEIVRRRGKCAEPKRYIEIQQEVYRCMAKKLQIPLIDTGSYSIEETHKNILALLKWDFKNDQT